MAIRAIDSNTSRTLLIKSTQLLPYADDNIITQKLTDGEEFLHTLDTVAKEVGLRINEGKMKIMMQSRNRTPPPSSINVEDLNIEFVDSFIYLGNSL